MDKQTDMNEKSVRNVVIEDPTITIKDIGGLEMIVQELQEKMAKSILEAPADILMPKGGVLLYGPPGCGKTVLVRAIANQTQANLIIMKGPELLCESEVYVQNVFEKVRSSVPCMLFLDGMESFDRFENAEGGRRSIQQILTEMDQSSSRKNIFIIGATTRPDIIDPAFITSGRLGHLVYIPLPDEISRVSILKAKLKTIPHTKDVDIPYLASQTTGYTGADLTEICQRACKLAIRESLHKESHLRSLGEATYEEDEETLPEVTQRHFMEAMKFARRSVAANEMNRYEAFKQNLQ